MSTTDTITTDAAEPAPRRVPIGEQVEEVGRAIRSLQHYPGRMKPETVAAKVERLGAAHATLSLVAAHADGLRVLISYLRRVMAENGGALPDVGEDYLPTGMELAALAASDAVKFVIEKFPGTSISDVKPTTFAPTGNAADLVDGEMSEADALAS